MISATAKPPETMPKQERSRARRAAMIEVGEALLMQRDIEDISIVDVTSALGYSTGSFYSGFSDKDAFFVAVQRSVNQKLAARMAEVMAPDNVAVLSAYERLALCIDLTLEFFRARRGVIASALRHEAQTPQAWAPNRESAQKMSDNLANGLPEPIAARLRIAIQMAFGTLVNAVLHDPGPMRLEDAMIGDQMKSALRPYLEGAG